MTYLIKNKKLTNLGCLKLLLLPLLSWPYIPANFRTNSTIKIPLYYFDYNYKLL